MGGVKRYFLLSTYFLTTKSNKRKHLIITTLEAYELTYLRNCLAPRFFSLKLVEDIDNCLNESDVGWAKYRVTRGQLLPLLNIFHQGINYTFNWMKTNLYSNVST